MAAHSPDFDSYYDDIQHHHHHHDLLIYKTGCCLWMPCFCRSVRLSSDGWHRLPTTSKRKHYSSWWTRRFKKIRELSVIKWKTFVSRFNKSKIGIGRNGKYMKKFQYDPCSYSLNFDEGPGHNGDLEDDYLHRAFSSRYAAIPASVKSSMAYTTIRQSK
ncbi:hypothetical protein FEM48_Zijuj04G0031300 [Ziziphus jujuba var. spinosa]|uniref:Uncharacterized protein n=1 Tax=Ziziphus jujuba var. spinosa TaxID=714518 RepID=A0A978VHH4_ZIZJJ|nr:hypothetical protein FEM48_Zijuj04G0031300 [Ziziphus jujuba var. spinosa]